MIAWVKNRSSVIWVLERIASWRSRVPAAEAKKAESASGATRLIPKPPFLMGIHTWAHWVSERSLFVMMLVLCLRLSSNSVNPGLSVHGEHRIRCCSLGAHSDALRRTIASWADTSSSLLVARLMSLLRSCINLSIVGPGKRGAPSRDACLDVICKKFLKAA